MQKRYYFDTCIWRDYFENREDRLRPLGEWAFSLIRQIIENEDSIIYSDVVEEELLMDYNPKEVFEIIAIVPSSLLLKAYMDKLANYVTDLASFSDRQKSIKAKPPLVYYDCQLF